MYSEDIITTQADIGFMNDDKFINAYQKCLEADKGRLLPNNYSIRWRIHTLLWASNYTSNLEGDFVDFGGGFGLFDDYGFPGHIDQKNSHDKFAKENNSLIYTCPTGQGILIK